MLQIRKHRLQEPYIVIATYVEDGVFWNTRRHCMFNKAAIFLRQNGRYELK